MNTYDPEKHDRKAMRLKGFKYSWAGSYFVTICSHNRKCIFGSVVNEKMYLNEIGQILHEEWLALPDRYPYIDLDTFQVMPNHMHGIVNIYDKPVKANHPDAGDPPSSLDSMMGAYKSIVFNKTLKIYKKKNQWLDKLWQERFRDRIIRNSREYRNIAHYIFNNPPNWRKDKLYVE